jgi:diguanylate cyclase (GGDEF)-like protein/PAS domain S-box-containing protein
VSWVEIWFLIPYLVTAVFSAGVGIYALTRRKRPGAGAFAGIVLAETAWTVSYLLQRFSSDIGTNLVWNSVQLSAALLTALSGLGFAIYYPGQHKNRLASTWNWAALLGGVVMILIWTDPIHHLIRIEPFLQSSGPFQVLVFQDGPAFLAITLFLYGLITLSTVLLTTKLFSSPRIFRLQIGTVLVGVSIPWAISLLSFTHVIPAPVHDITPLAFFPSDLMMFWALFRYQLFEVSPIARDVLVERMRDGVIVLDPYKRIVDFNPAAREILGLSNTETPGKFVGRTLPALSQFLFHLIDSPNARSELGLKVMGEPANYEVSSMQLFNRLGSPMGHLVVFRDITEQKRTEEKLYQMARTDYLTGILNRRAFFELATPEMERSRRYHHSLAFVLIDVDNFKKVNDTYGHLVGDQVLQNLASLLQQGLREMDKLARYGGEEMVIMLPETDAQGAWQTAERLRQTVERAAVQTPKGAVKVTLSLGVTAYQLDSDDETVDRLLGKADQALYQAKRQGRNRVRVWDAQEGIGEEQNGKTG